MKIIKIPNKKSFTLVEILDMANQAYEDQFLEVYYTREGKLKKNGSGSSLAKFIVIELIETFSPKADKKAQLLLAMRAVERAKEQLGDLQDFLEGIHDAC
jgi:hypothetical protein